MKKRKKAKAKAAKRVLIRKGRKTKLKSRKGVYNPQTGTIGGRAAAAQERLELLAEKYMADGMSPSDARARAREEMRANPRKDWRLKS